MNYAVYARVSTSEQIKGYSIASQLEACREYVTGLGGQVMKEYIDAASGRDDQKRPQFQRMVKEALAGKFSAIVVSSFDRFARNMEHAVVYKSLLRKEGIQVISVMEPLDQSSPLAFIHEGIIDLFAAFYSINLSTKIRSGQAKAIQAGRWPHKAPLGYANRGGWIEVAETGEKIAWAFREFATGYYTLETWADTAYAAGITSSGRKISFSNWSKTFHNRFYIGVLSWNGLEITGKHEPLVDEATFNQVQEVLRRNDRQAVHRVYRPYLLRSLLFSLDTQSVMTGATGKTNKGGYKYYRSRKTPYHSVPAEVLESQIETVLQRVTVSPHDLANLENRLDGSILLALRVAPHLGAVYHWLKTEEQRHALLGTVVARYGLKVSGKEIVDVEPLAPFGFKFEMGEVEVITAEPSPYYFCLFEVPQW